jgi:hypothetical protein
VTTLETTREQLLKQDNRGTEHPVFVVEREELVYGVSRDYTDRTVPRDGGDGPSESRRVGVVGVWVFETACFAEAAADRYVAENSHKGTFRVFVHSAHRNREWQAMRAMLMSECAPSKLGHDPKVALMLLHEKAETSYGRGKIDGVAAGSDERVVLADRLRAARSERDELIQERDALRERADAAERERDRLRKRIDMGTERLRSIASMTQEEFDAWLGNLIEAEQQIAALAPKSTVVLCDYCKGAILPGARVHVEGGKAWHGCQAHAPTTHARYLDAWTAADGVVLWWTEFEPKVQYLGTPLDDDFPDHVTHWTAVVRIEVLA